MTDSRRRVLNCFDRLERLVGNRVPAHGSEAPYLVNLLEAIQEEKWIATELLDREAVFGDDPVPSTDELEAHLAELAKGGEPEELLVDTPELRAKVKALGVDLAELEAKARGGHRDPVSGD